MKKAKKTVSKSLTSKAHNKNVASKTIIYLHKNCQCCSAKMIRISATDKYVSCLNDRKRYYAEIYSCPNEKCELHGKRMKPVEFTNLSFPYCWYWMDIIAKIGLLRFKENKSIPEIHKIITNENKHVELSERHTENLLKRFMLCLELSKLYPVAIKQKFKALDIKWLVLSLDWIQPEKGNDILYIVREVQSWEILLAIYLEFSDEPTVIDKIMKPIKELVVKINIPVFWWIVDKQESLTKAIESIFPNTPIQHCQSHFLKEVRKPLREKDSEMNSLI